MDKITEKEAQEMFVKGLALIQESGMFDQCGAYAPGGWDSDNSEITALYLTNDPNFMDYCRAYERGKD